MIELSCDVVGAELTKVGFVPSANISDLFTIQNYQRRCDRSESEELQSGKTK